MMTLSMPSKSIRRIFALIGAGALWCFFGGAAYADQKDEEIIVLPKYEIKTDRVLPPLEKWRYVSVPGFEILSDTSRGNTKDFVRDFYLLQQVVRVLFPSIQETSALPSYIVLCSNQKDFELLVPTAKAASVDPVSGRFMTDGERNAMIVDFSPIVSPPSLNPAADSESKVVVMDSTGSEVRLENGGGGGMNTQFRNFYLQYFRFLIRKNLKTLPPLWLEEGLVELLASTDFSKDGISFAKVGGEDAAANGVSGADSQGITEASYGSITSGPTVSSISGSADAVKAGSFNRIFRGNRLIPLKEFFAVTREIPQSKRPSGYSAQAYLFTHMCLFGNGQRYAKSFYQFALESSGGAVTEDAFKKYFKMTFASMGFEMRSYVDQTNYKSQEFKFHDKSQSFADAPAFEVGEASDAVSSRIVGEVLRLAGNRDAALNRLIAPYVRGQYDADLLAALGLAELEAAHVERAKRFLGAAVKAGTSRTRAYYELAKIRAKEAGDVATSEKRQLTSAEIAGIQELLYLGLKHPPTMVPLCSMLVRTWLSSAAPPTKAQFEELVKIGKANCTDLGLVYWMAELSLKYGYIPTGRQFVTFGVSNAPDVETKKKFETLSRSLPLESVK